MDVYLTDRQVAARLGIHRSTVWRWAAVGLFPVPVKLAGGTTRWRLSAIEGWERHREEP